jgi:hypothetical protein
VRTRSSGIRKNSEVPRTALNSCEFSYKESLIVKVMEEPSLLSNAADRRKFARALLAWFTAQARDLPWRRTRDLYSIWISEIMLQQTQVATVIGYYERFLAAFPTVHKLAAASETQVLRLWEGLGYYRRARQLHAAAKQIVIDHGSEFPRSYEAVRALPGIGRYTAGAILHRPRPAAANSRSEYDSRVESFNRLAR